MKKFMFFAMSVFIMAACSSDNENNGNASNGNPNGNTDSQGRVMLQISGGIDVDVSTQARTRAANSAWEANDQIGVYAVATGGTSVITEGSNKYYTFSDTGNEETSGTNYRAFNGASDPVLLPADDSAVDIYAYYPYSDGATVPTAVPVNAGTDFMTTGKTDKTIQGGDVTIKKTTATCQLLFAHRLSKLVFNLQNGTGFTDVDITGTTSLTIGSQTKQAGTYNIYTSTLTYGTDAADATLSAVTSTTTSTYDKTFEAIVLPNEATNNPAAARTVTITISGSTYTFSIPAETSFAAGSMYTYNVTVNRTGLSISAAITPWADGDNGNPTVVTAQ